ncbi:hypothetical protein ACFVZM_09015 [Streptomyces sioyaensis]|uniref:hypothetical protein n=1 Tax=Streptomyces sioyaensis TaxID=67364 RepID=UPI003678F6A3
MARGETQPPTPRFKVHLTDDYVPRVPAGQFRIEAAQTISGIENGGQLPGAARLFEVRAPQFQLAPGGVHAVSPAPETQGCHGRVLAHVTLAARILPWQRTIDPGELETGPIEARPPWLALLVFAAGELPGDPNAAGITDTMAISDLLWPAEPDLGEIRPKIPQSQVAEGTATECRVLRVPGAVFAAVCPREDELRHLAHVRSVRDPAADSLGEELTEGDFSVVISGRLPDPEGGRHVAHLVSLEGCREALAYAASAGPHKQDARLVSLHHWCFDALPEGEGGAGFVQRVHDLLFDDAADGAVRDLLLRIPVPGPSGGVGTGPDDEARQRATDRLAQGWLPLPYQVDSGEETYAWYRGPFTAAPSQKLPPMPEDGWTTAGGLLAYDPDWAVFDTGWAVAWTVGRALALADDDFAGRLGNWRDRARFRAAQLAQRLAAAPPESDPAASLGPRPRAQALRERVEDGTLERLIRELSEVRTGPVRPRSAGSAAADLTQTGAPPRQAPLHRVLAEALAGPGTASGPHAQRLTALRAALREELAEDEETPLADWFARLRLLHGVPFAYLVPSETMLPPESLRFFHVDPGWLTALQAGAESVGASGEADRALAAFAGPWRSQATAADDPGPCAGMLIRSALTRECPELSIQAWQGEETVGLLRRELLAGDILLVLFDRVPDAVELSEPPEGLSFGADPHPVDGTPVLNLRSLGGGDAPPGETLDGAYFPQEPGEDGLLAYLRPNPKGKREWRRVLDLRPADPDALIGALATRLREAGELSDGPLAPAPFGLQLINAPYRQMILTPPLAPTPPPGAGHE